jgi:hypothetical protein
MPRRKEEKLDEAHQEKVAQIKAEADTKRRKASDYIEKIQAILKKKREEEEQMKLGENHA